MRTFNLAIVCLFFFLVNPVLSHGGNSDCAEECESMYCPPEELNKEMKDSWTKMPIKRSTQDYGEYQKQNFPEGELDKNKLALSNQRLLTLFRWEK